MNGSHDDLQASPLGVASAVLHRQAVFRQLSQALAILSNTAEMVLEGKSDSVSAQQLRLWLQPNARIAETSIQHLREMIPGQTQTLTELTQCLTVLVLAADMIAHNQLTSTTSADTYDLLQRNADRAMHNLHELRKLIAEE